MHKNPCRTSLIITSYLCSTKQLSKPMSPVFKIIYNQIKKCLVIEINFRYFESVQCCIGFISYLLKAAVKHLIENCFFTIYITLKLNITLKQDIVVSKGIDTAPFWVILFSVFI